MPPLAVCMAAVLSGSGIAADIVNPHVTTDRSVDTSSVAAMVKSLIKPGMTDEDKALAVYNFIRRTMFHYRYLTRYAGGGTMDLINGVGYCLCTPTAGTQARLCTAAGLKGHVLNTPGHGSVTVFYGGQWHWMDAFMGGCVWNKKRTGIASLTEVQADPALLKRKDPSPVPLLPCGAVLYQDSLRWEPDNKKYHAACGPDDLAWAARAKPGKHRPMVWGDVSSLDITLRPGETYARFWDHEPGMYFLFRTGKEFAPPHHFCGVAAERRDTVNWPYWKPYVKEIESTDPETGKKVTVRTGRYWANGRLTWKPDLTSADVLQHFAVARNVRVDAAKGELVPIDPDKPAVVEWTVACPYMLQGGWLQAKVAGDVAASIKVSVRKKPARSEPMDLRDAPGGKAKRAPLRPHFLKARGTRGYTLRLELKGKDARVGAIELVTIFQHNMYALPQLMPGKNVVKVTVGRPEALKRTRLVLEYAWDQGGKTVTERRVVDTSPYAFSTDIPGDDLPRMRHLTLTNEGPPQPALGAGPKKEEAPTEEKPR